MSRNIKFWFENRSDQGHNKILFEGEKILKQKVIVCVCVCVCIYIYIYIYIYICVCVFNLKIVLLSD